MNTKRIEQLCRIVERCLDKMVETQCTDDIYCERYHRYYELLYKELDTDLRLNPYELHVSNFMRDLITHYTEENLEIERNVCTFGYYIGKRNVHF